jgi:hypothetical protein
MHPLVVEAKTLIEGVSWCRQTYPPKRYYKLQIFSSYVWEGIPYSINCART